jgi:hypothetical protein
MSRFRRSPHTKRPILVLACVLLFSAPGGAQEVDSIDYLPAVLSSGERVVVSGVVCDAADGASPLAQQPCLARAATIRGQVERLAGDRLVVAGSGRQYTFPLESIERIERSKDGVWNGAFIGYGVGVAIMTAISYADCRGPRDTFIDLCGGNGVAFGLAAGAIITGPIGFGIGALADAGISRPRLVFVSSRPPAVSRTAPGPLRRGAGIAVSIGF